MAGPDKPGLHLFGGHPPLSVPGAAHTGRVLWVGSTAVPGGVVGVDDVGSYGYRPERPFATIDYAIGQCTGSRGDTIYVLAGHAETVVGTIALDVAGVRLIGLGIASNRPVLTFDTTGDVLAVSAANCEIANMEFVCNVGSHTRFINLQAAADGAWIHHNLFREGTNTGLSMVEWTGAADDVVIEDNLFYAPTAGNYDEAILITSTPTRGHIRRNFIFGDWDEGGINNPVGNVATLFEISDNQITNLLVGAEAIDLLSATTGMMSRNMVSTDVLATAIVDGSMRCNGNLWSATTDATHGVSVPVTPADTTTADTVLGVLIGTGGIATMPSAAVPANNINAFELMRSIWGNQCGTAGGENGIATFPAAAAPANNVSMAEVLREAYDQSDKAVTNTTGTLVNGTTIFTIAGGPIEILSLVARCVTGNDATASTLQWSADPTDGAPATFSAASASLANAAAGAMVVLQGTSLATAPTVNATGVGLGQTVTNGIVIGAGIITTTIGVGSTTGTWQHHLRYRPLSRGVTIS